MAHGSGLGRVRVRVKVQVPLKVLCVAHDISMTTGLRSCSAVMPGSLAEVIM